MVGKHPSIDDDQDRRITNLELRVGQLESNHDVLKMKHEAVNTTSTAIAKIQASVRREIRELADAWNLHIGDVERRIEEDRKLLNNLVVEVHESNQKIRDGLAVADENGEKTDRNTENTALNTQAIERLGKELKDTKESINANLQDVPEKVAMAIKGIHGVEFIGWSADKIFSYLIDNKGKILTGLGITATIIAAIIAAIHQIP